MLHLCGFFLIKYIFLYLLKITVDGFKYQEDDDDDDEESMFLLRQHIMINMILIQGNFYVKSCTCSPFLLHFFILVPTAQHSIVFVVFVFWMSIKAQNIRKIFVYKFSFSLPFITSSFILFIKVSWTATTTNKSNKKKNVENFPYSQSVYKHYYFKFENQCTIKLPNTL